MNAQKWLDAAKAYETEQISQIDRARKENADNRKAEEAKRIADYERVKKTRKVADELNSFICSGEGQAAQRLMALSRRHIVFTEENEGGGLGLVWVFDGFGLGVSREPMGMWVAYSRKEDVPKAVRHPSDPYAVVSAMMMEDNDPRLDRLVEWLRNEIDKIADAAPKATVTI